MKKRINHRKGYCQTLIIVLLFLGMASVSAVDWTYENVDGWNIDMIYTSLTLDKNGWPHIVYRDNSNGNLKYSYRDSAGWHISIVQTGLNCYWPSLQLDTNGYPQIAYKTTTGGNMLRFSKKDASGWYHEIVHQSSGANIGSFPSLVLDRQGQPCIAYRADFGGGANYVYYAHKDTDGSWQKNLAGYDPAELGEDRGGIALGFDAYGAPHIVFFNTGGNIIHLWRRGLYEGWTSETVVSGTGIGTRLSMKIDGNIIHIAYNKENGEDLGYAKKTIAGWSNEIVDSDGSTGDHPSIFLDIMGYPHISYNKHDVDYLRYARLTPTGWRFETVYDANNDFLYGSLGINESDEPHISAFSYYGSNEYRLKFFRPRSYGPRAFSLLSPANGFWANAKPKFRWQQCAYRGDSLLRYELWIDGVLNKVVPKTQPYAIPDNSLPAGLRTWRVKAFKINGDSILSASWSVNIDPNPPTAFNLSSPASNTWTRSRKPIFAWQASSDAESGLRKYQIYIDDTLVNDSISITSLSGQPIWRLPDGSHTWHIKAVDNVGNTRQSNQTWIIKIDSTPPNSISLVSPPSYSWTNDSCPTFKWRRTTDAGIGVSHYQLWIYATTWTLWIDSIPQSASETLAVTIPTSRPLSHGTRYWYITAIDSLGNGRNSSQRTLYVDLLPPNPFSLSRPRNDSIINIPTPIFYWRRTTDQGIGGVRYQLWIDSVPNMVGLIDTSSAPSSPLSEGRRRWFVLAIDSFGWTRKSNETWSAILDWNPPDTFRLISPINNDTVSSLPTLIWRPSSDRGSGLKKYQLWIDGVINRDSIRSTDTSTTPIASLSPGLHNWFVKAYDYAGGVTSSNNTGSFWVAQFDVGVTQIIAPSGTIDSGIVVTPQARVKNFGNIRTSFPVIFRIGTFYNNTQNVTNLNPGDSTAVGFAACTLRVRGTHATKCSTALAGDANPGNNSQTGSVTVRVRDIGVIQIVAPTGTVDSGVTIVPQARIQNFGSTAETFPVTFKIGTFYNQTRNKTLSAGAIDTVNFPSWTAIQRGTNTTKCSTTLTGDLNPANDTLSNSVTVRVKDVGVTQIIVPSGIVDSGAIVIPQARVKNFGTQVENFPVTFRIGTFYTNTQNVTNLGSGDSTIVNFALCTLRLRGTHTTICTTALSGDMNPANNSQIGSVTVRVIDVGVTHIIIPSGIIDSGTVVTPQAKVKNFGTNPASFPVTFSIGTFYTNTQNVANLNPGDSTVVNFTSCTLRIRGMHTTKCTTALTGDANPTNNSQTGSVTVRIRDVGVIQIVAPTGIVDSGLTVTPQARVRNDGTATETFPVFFKIGDFYNQTRNKTLAAGVTDTVNFPAWTVAQRGFYTTKCSTALVGDVNPANDTLSDSVIVRVRDVGVTQIITPSGTIDSGTVVIPQAIVKNYGDLTENFPVTFKIGTFYTNTQNINNLNPGDSTVVSFDSWIALQRGTHTTKCTTGLVGDLNPGNNTLTGSVIVRVLDVGVTAILSPVGTIDSGATVIPRVKVKNFGNASASFPVWFRIHYGNQIIKPTSFNKAEVLPYTTTNYHKPSNEIASLNRVSITKEKAEIDQVYEDSIWLTLAPGDSTTRNFDIWVPTVLDTYGLESFTVLLNDMNSQNDTVLGSVIVRRAIHDVGVVRIITPIGTIDSGTVVIPKASVQNFGVLSETFLVRFKIGTFYTDDTVITLVGGITDTVQFASWTAIQVGTYITKCTTLLATDTNPANDFVIDSVRVRPIVGIDEPSNLQLLPMAFNLENCIPNPFIYQTAIRYALPKDCQVNLAVYNSSGFLVRILKEGNDKAGFYKVIWDGRDSQGMKLAPGVYFYTLKADGLRIQKKMLILR